MPTSAGLSAFALAAILTTLSPVAAVVLAVIAFLWELAIFYKIGSDL